MTDTLFRNARLIDPEAGTETPGHLILRGGVIAEVVTQGEAPPDDGFDQIIDATGLCLAPGIVDIGVKVSEPGERHKESFRSAGRAA